MSRYFPSDDKDDWFPITINGNLPLLGMVPRIILDSTNADGNISELTGG